MAEREWQMWLLEQSRSGFSVAAAQRRASLDKERQFRVKAREVCGGVDRDGQRVQ